MSHRQQRKEKDCLNCGTEVLGKYCHNCGQENIETKETLWHLLDHFFKDITHFDGQFFDTSKYLLTRPGFLSRQYMLGKRAKFLNPIRLYLFTSALFFLFFFSFVKPGDTIKISKTKQDGYVKTKGIIEQEKNNLAERLKKKDMDSSIRTTVTTRLNSLNADLIRLQTDSTHLEDLNYYKPNFYISHGSYETVEQYDSTQKKLDASKRDGWFSKFFKRKKIELNSRYENNGTAFLRDVSEKFFHKFPQVLFVSLPLFALLLQLLYVRRKQYYYADHAIYSIHLYCAMFVLLFVQISLVKLSALPYLGWLYFVSFFVIIYMFYYVYKSMRTFYMQRRAKTIFKYFLLLLLSFFIMSLLFVSFFAFSALTL